MVKGVSRRVIVVRSPDPRFFEEAIFIVKEDIASNDGVSSQELLKEAQTVANSYVKSNVHEQKKIISKLTAPALVAVGAGLGAIIFSIISNIF